MLTVVSHENVANFNEVVPRTADVRKEHFAFRYLIDGETDGPQLSYADVERRSRAVAAAIGDKAGVGDRALMLYGSGLEFVPAYFGCVRAGVIAVPAYPPRPERPWQGMQLVAGIARNARPSVVLTGGDDAARLRQLFSGLPELDGVPWINTDLAPDVGHECCRGDEARPDDIVMLQYTSGSTGDPKGVMVTHRNLLQNQRMMQLAFNHCYEAEDVTGVCWLPPYHDMGLMAGIIQCVYVGCPCVVMPPLGILLRPSRWLHAMSRYRAQTSGGPNFIYELCVNRIPAEEAATLDLSRWNIAGVGAEPIQADTLERFARHFEAAGFRREAFYPSYGLAEATLFVTGGSHLSPPVVRDARATIAEGETDRRRMVGCGQPWLGTSIEIVDPETRRRCFPGDTGEIWVAGPCVAAGYWNAPEATTETFRARLADGNPTEFLRTGDLGTLIDGELFVTGRLKDLIIVRGRNHHPHDIERSVQSVHAALKEGCGAAFGVEVGGEERVIVAQEIDRHSRRLDMSQLFKDVRREVSLRHELLLHELVLLKRGTLPKTTSGKVQRTATRDRYLAGTLAVWRPEEGTGKRDAEEGTASSGG
ncbi:MAG: fatty acyl-AMP ligase [Planctomycetaceae bacterium]|nr:fatty acyl-AMP ligase [Planctomycetaceae bacterium]